MKINSIEHPVPLESCNRLNDNVDVFVKLENGNEHCITVATIYWISNCIGRKCLPSGAPHLIVKELEFQLKDELLKI